MLRIFVGLQKQGILTRIKTHADTSQIHINARLRCVWKQFLSPPLRGTPLTTIPEMSLCTLDSRVDANLASSVPVKQLGRGSVSRSC